MFKVNYIFLILMILVSCNEGVDSSRAIDQDNADSETEEVPRVPFHVFEHEDLSITNGLFNAINISNNAQLTAGDGWTYDCFYDNIRDENYSKFAVCDDIPGLTFELWDDPVQGREVGAIFWTPDSNINAGDYEFFLSSENVTDLEYNRIYYHINYPPTINDVQDAAMSENSVMSVDFIISDLDSGINCADVDVISSLTNLIGVADISITGGSALAGESVTCSAELIPVPGRSGTSTIEFTANSEYSLSDSDSFVLTVNASGNTAPSFVLAPAQASETGTTFSLAFRVDDTEDGAFTCPTPNSPQTLSITNTDVAVVSSAIISATGNPGLPCEISGVVTNGFEGSTTITLTATDSGGLSTYQKFTFVFLPPANSAPTVLAPLVTSSPAGTVNVTTFDISDVEDDLDCSSVSVRVSGASPFQMIDITGAEPTCTITFTPFPGSTGDYGLSLQVVDSGGLSSSVNFTYSLTAKGASPPEFIPDSVSTIETLTNTAATFEFDISDPDQSLICSSDITNIAVSNMTTISDRNLSVTGNSEHCTLNYVTLRNISQVDVTLTLTDNTSLTDTLVIPISVTNTNSPPVISDTSDQSGLINEVHVGTFTISDPNEQLDCETHVASSGVNNTVIQNVVISNGLIVGSCAIYITPVTNATGTSNVTLTVSDSSNLTDTDSFNFTVGQGNTAPSIDDIASQNLSENTNHVFTFNISDAEDLLSCSSSLLASGYNNALIQNIVFTGGLNEPTCEVTITPVANTTGSTTVTFTVTDSEGLTDTDDFLVSISGASNTAPTINDIISQSGPLNQTISVDFIISDVDEVLNCNQDVIATFDNTAIQSVSISGVEPNCNAIINPVSNITSNTVITLTVSDTQGLQDSDQFFVEFSSNNPPQIGSAFEQYHFEELGQTVQFDLPVEDPDGSYDCVTATTFTNVDSSITQNVYVTGMTPNCVVNVVSTGTFGFDKINFSIQDPTGLSTQGYFFAYFSEEFQSTWQVTAGQSITLPRNASSLDKIQVHWGDGIITKAGQGSTMTHTYSSAGSYNMKILGSIGTWSFNNSGTSKDSLISVDAMGRTGWKNIHKGFFGCFNLQSFTSDANDIIDLTNFSFKELFRDTTLLTSLSLTGWDTSSVTDMEGVFSYNDPGFNNNVPNIKPDLTVDLSSWTFSGADKLNKFFINRNLISTGIDNWNVLNITHFSHMFYGVTGNANLTAWSPSSAMSFGSMFEESTLNPDVSDFVTAQTTYLGGMFRDNSMATPNTSAWVTTNLTNLYQTFYNASNANPDMSGWNFSNIAHGGVMEHFIRNSGINNTNYSNFLIKLNADVGNSATPGVNDIISPAQYNASAFSARDELINVKDWPISDQGAE